MASPLNATEWQIRAPAPACGRCARAFGDGETFRSRLIFAEGEGYRREDVCAACWPAAADAAEISSWRGVFRAPPPPAPEPLKRETAESLLRRLVEAGDPARAGAMFVLSVMLERRRVLVERDVRIHADGARTRIYEHRGTGESFVILDPGLRLDDLEKVQREVLVLLENATGDAAAAAPAAAGSGPCST